jgi:hypothetical protein
MSEDPKMRVLPKTHSNFVVGYRYWFISSSETPPKLNDSIKLKSLASSYIWPVLEPARGNIHECFDKNDKSSKKLGLYARRNFTRALEERVIVAMHARPTGLPAIFGSVALWGDIVEHERGLRASYGYPLVIATVPQYLKPTRQTYGRTAGRWTESKNRYDRVLGYLAAKYAVEVCDQHKLEERTKLLTEGKTWTLEEK